VAAGVRAEDLPTHARGLAELLARQPRIDAATGRQRVELIFEDGRLVEAFVHDRIPARELEQDEVAVTPPIPSESP
jgi:hypothetical protein